MQSRTLEVGPLDGSQQGSERRYSEVFERQLRNISSVYRAQTPVMWVINHVYLLLISPQVAPSSSGPECLLPS